MLIPSESFGSELTTACDTRNEMVTMAVNAEELDEIDRMLATPDVDAQAFLELRRRFPYLSWTRCDASDVTEAPFRSYPAFDVHLLDSADHCSQITSDPAHATGIVLAKRSAVS